MSGTTLADWLRAQDDTVLVALLRARPDLATPVPADTAVLAARISTRASVSRACEDLDTFTLTVLEALLVLDADLNPVPQPDLARLLGKEVKPRPLKQALATLRGRALLWGPDDALSTPPASRDAVAAFPAGLGRSVPALADVDLEPLGEDELRVLKTLADGPPIGQTRDAALVVALEQAKTPIQKLLARGLLIRRDGQTVELPREVGLLVRGDRPLGRIQVTEPPMKSTALDVSVVDETGAGEALELLRHAESLIAAWSDDPPAVLRTGGLGVREMRKIAKDLEIDEQRASLLIEVVVAAGLVGDSEGAEPEWVPTALADSWLTATPEVRWSTLAQAWLDVPRLPGLIGQRDERERLLNPLSAELNRANAPRDRRWVLEALAGREPGTTVADASELAAVLAWRAPRRGGRLRDELVRWTMAEGTALAVLSRGAMTTAGRVLIGEGPALASKQLADSLPAPVDHFLVQADLTVVAPGRLEPELADELALVADVESAGGATVYRVGDNSVRRAFDAGRTASDLHELFRKGSRTPIPQSLTYLIDDAARKHGRLRGGSAGSFLRCDDPVLLTEVMAHPAADTLELRKIAPTVLVSPLVLADVLDGLRAAGFAPAAEGADGRVLDLRARARRIPGKARATRRPAHVPTPSEEQLGELVRLVRAGDRARSTQRGERISVPANHGNGPSATLGLLQQAARDGRSVLVDLVDSHGTAATRVIKPQIVGGGVLEGYDLSYGEVRRFPLHRITSAALVED
ncbi:helicase-associated domain-containing protein [Umezawaea sp. Da 62-37]|uniref:helicase-associated domain-containing protein n=1 Tax=Umezawaea sp. Da 62-37 TaxID=3075927 RepID=UPI0028F6E560|nr:helicase-associated domain-containing protein [Umezawaea sp. Da 62-37]WNV82011.1 helicase-associated domain-containing protein [Umezawaea sp. Da 62-37]